MRICLSCEKELPAGGWTCSECGFAPRELGDFPAFAPELAEQNDDYESDCFEEAVELGDENYWRAARKEIILWGWRRYLAPRKPTSFMEMGCGLGYILKAVAGEVPGVMLTGSDIYLESLEHSRRALPDGATLLQADASRLPFREEFDVLGTFDVLEHLEDDEAALAQIYRAVKPGGGLLITVPQHPFLWSQRDEYLCHKRRYTRGELVGKVEAAGFEIVRVTSFVSLLFPAMLISNLRNRAPRKDYHPYTALRVGRLVNRLLSRVLGVERLLIRLGLSFPFGGSLFLVASRPATL